MVVLYLSSLDILSGDVSAIYVCIQSCIYLYMNVWFPPGQPEVVYLLLNAGLNPRQKDSYGQVQIVDTTCMYMYMYMCLYMY